MRLKNLPTIVFLLSLVVSALLIVGFETSKISAERARLQYLQEALADRINYELCGYNYINEAFEHLIIESHGRAEYFESIAARFMNDLPLVSNISLAPNGKTIFVYPPSHSSSTRVSVFDDRVLSQDALYARDTGHDSLVGPYISADGKREIMSIHPIIPEIRAGFHRFWGFSMVALKFPEILENVRWEALTRPGYDYKILHAIPDSDNPVVLQNDVSPLTNPVTVDFQVANGSWTFQVAPHRGWIDTSEVVPSAVFFLMLSMLLAYVTHLLQSLKLRTRILSEMAIRDDLTKLFNLRRFIGDLEELDRNNEAYAVLYIDVNDFKIVNDTYGHSNGNVVLKEVASRLLAGIAEHGGVYRIGGDEFAVIMVGSVPNERCEELISHVRQACEIPLKLDGNNVIIPRISVGFACCCGTAAEHYQEVIHAADVQMYEDKLACKRRRREEEEKFSAANEDMV